ncbi:hypothetical protein LP419_17540 [Massilia sp. H-1]|nr:hypothetical protein LP419_17540 [Massilia sp. H-1]
MGPLPARRRLAGGRRARAGGRHAIVALVLGASSFSGSHGTSVFGDESALTVYNGLGIAVDVEVDGRRLRVAPATSAPLVL